MNGSLVLSAVEPGELRSIIDRAADALAGAVTAADVLDARDQASFAYDTAKSAARLARAKGAHDEIVARAYRAQADALEIESLAKRRLADEYDAAQERGEVASHGGKRGNQHSAKVDDENLGGASAPDRPATAAEAGISRLEVFEARKIRDAIEREPGIVRRVLDDILKTGDEPTKAKLRKELAGPMATVRSAANAEKKQRRQEREITLAGRIKALPDKKYGVILADPEWRFEPYSRESGMDRSPDNHYPTSSTDDIATRDVESIAADDCVLFLWATAPMLEDAWRVIKAWGFVYKTHSVWHKQRTGAQRGTGYWYTGEHELLMVATRGNVPAPAMGTQFGSVFAAPVGEHSEKPECALEMIEAYFPNLPKIELNRRGPARPGWDAWGLEAEDAAVVPEVAVDRVAEALIASGFAPNTYILELNRGLTNDRPLDLPSRLFRFPVEFMDRKRTGGESRLLLRHPDLSNYPPVAAFLDDVETKTGIKVEWSPVDEFGRDISAHWRWLHAVDLCTDKHWRSLLETIQFAGHEAVFGAVLVNLESKSLSAKNARAILTELGSSQQLEQSTALFVGKAIWPYQHDKEKLISPNFRERTEATAWLAVHGIEAGLFGYVGTHLSVTAAGMALRADQAKIDAEKETA